MSSPNHVAVALICDYLAHGTVSADTLGEAIKDPELLGEVIVRLAVIGGEALRLSAADAGTTAEAMLDVIDAAAAD